MSTKYRDLYKAKVRKAIPVTPEEQDLFHLARGEQQVEEIATAVLEKLAQH